MTLATIPQMDWAAKLMMKNDTGGTFKTQPIISETLSYTQERLDNNGLRGTRTLEEKMSVGGLKKIRGGMNFSPNKIQLNAWLPFITGATDGALAETVKGTLYVECWRGTGGGTFGPGAVNSAIFKGSSGKLLELDLDLIFKSWADLASPTQQNLDAGLPCAFSGFVLTNTTAAQAYHMKDFEVKIDHQILDDYYVNSVDLAELVAKARIITLDFTVPYSAEGESITALTIAATTGELNHYNVTLVGTMPDGSTITFIFPKLMFLEATPNASGKEIDLKVKAQAFGTTARNDEMTITVS
jgi:hypothetical protein